MWCKACGGQLGDPEEVLHDPDNELGIIEGGVSNPDSGHLKVVKGEKGVRKQCARTGQMTKLVDQPPDKEDEGGGKEQEREPPSGGAPEPNQDKGGRVYDLEEDKSAKDILIDVISNPSYELDEPQIEEVKSWLPIYNGQLPPDVMEDILSNMNGVSKQQAGLMRQKYEAMLNKWIQEQSQDDGGPPLGAVASQPTSPGSAPPTPSPKPSPPQNGGGGGGGGGTAEAQREGAEAPSRNEPELPPEALEEEPEPDMGLGGPASEVREERRKRRMERRQDVVDEMAEEMARNMASDMGRMYSDFREIFTTLIKRKAEKDPDWFFEKADTFGMDIIEELSEPSEAKKREMEQGGSSNTADSMVDDVMSQMGEGGGGSEEPTRGEPQQQRTQQQRPEPEPEPEPSRPESTKEPTPEEQGEHPMRAGPEAQQEPEDTGFEDEDEAFEEIMGELGGS